MKDFKEFMQIDGPARILDMAQAHPTNTIATLADTRVNPAAGPPRIYGPELPEAGLPYHQTLPYSISNEGDPLTSDPKALPEEHSLSTPLEEGLDAVLRKPPKSPSGTTDAQGDTPNCSAFTNMETPRNRARAQE